MNLRIDQGKALISLIKKRARFGFAVAIDKIFYDAQIGQIDGLPTAYSFCVMSCMMQIRAWLRKNKSVTKVAYMFESGHHHATEASRVMHNIAVHPNTKLAYRYSSHTFMEKTDALPLQAADMLAWQVHHFHERCSNGNCEPRKDYRALIRPIDSCYLHSADDLRKFKKLAIADGLIAG